MMSTRFISNLSSASSLIVLGILLASQPVFGMDDPKKGGLYERPKPRTISVQPQVASVQRKIPAAQSVVPVNQAFWEDTTSKNFYRVGPNIEGLALQEDNQAEGRNPTQIQKIRSAFFAKARERDGRAMLALANSYLAEKNFSEALEWHIIALADDFCRTRKITKDIFIRIQNLIPSISEKLEPIKDKLKGGTKQGTAKAAKVTRSQKEQLRGERDSLESLRSKIDRIQRNIVYNWKFDQERFLEPENFLDRLLLDERKWETGAESYYNLLFFMKTFDQNPIVLCQTTKNLLDANIQYSDRKTDFLEKAKRLERHIETLYDAQKSPSQNYIGALYNLGFLYDDGLFQEEPTEQILRAAQLYVKSGNEKAFHNLRRLFIRGRFKVKHEGPEQDLMDKMLYEKALQFLKKAGTAECYEILGDLYALGDLCPSDSIVQDHPRESLSELSDEDREIQSAKYYWKSGSMSALENVFRLCLEGQLDDEKSKSAEIDYEILQKEYNNWLNQVRMGKIKVTNVAIEALLYLKKILYAPEGNVEKAVALLETHYDPANAFKHMGGVCLFRDHDENKDTRLRNAAVMFEKSGSPVSLRMLSAIYLELNEYDRSEDYALQAQAMGEHVEDIFECLKEFKISQTESELSSEEEEEVILSPVDNIIPLPEKDETLEPNDILGVKPDSQPFDEKPAVSEKGVQHAPMGLTKKERKEVKKLRKTQREIKLHDLFSKEREKLKKQRAVQCGPWTIVDSQGSPYSANQNLINDILLQPWGLQGAGKPEILKNTPKGLTVYSRRISIQDRLLYVLEPQTQRVVVLKDKGHYEGNTSTGNYDVSQVLKEYLRSMKK